MTSLFEAYVSVEGARFAGLAQASQRASAYGDSAGG